MRLKKIIELQNSDQPLFNISFTTIKKKEDGSLSHTLYQIQIPNIFTLMYCGDRKMCKPVSKIFKDDTLSTAQKLVKFLSAVGSVTDSYKWKWGALMDSMELYYNPLYNVDGTEVVESEFAQRQMTDVNGARQDGATYGEAVSSVTHGAQELTDEFGQSVEQNASGQRQMTDTIAQQVNQDSYGAHTDTTQYGADITEQTTAPTQKITHNNVDPFNDTDNTYDTTGSVESTIETTDETNRHSHTDQVSVGAHTDNHTIGGHTDTHTDAAHTDTLTRNQHTDTHSAASYTDTQTQQQHVDTFNTGTQTNTHTDAEHTDTVTTRRFGNIGVTKSTELLKSYYNLQQSVYEVVLNDILSIISVGY